MVKVFVFLPRRQDVTEAFFHKHWATRHVELASRITTVRRYVQSHRITAAVPGLANPIYDGIVESWFDDVATAAGLGDDPNYTEGALLDEQNFIDVAQMAFLISNENVVRAGAPLAKNDAGAKLLLLLRRRDGLDPTDFASHLGDASAAIGEAVPAARRVTVATPTSEMYADGGEPQFDSVVGLWFADADELERAWSEDGKAVLAAVGAFVDVGRSAAFPAEEFRVIWPQDEAAVV